MEKSNKKILFYIERLSGGGAEQVTATLANLFYNNGFDVEILILNKSNNEYWVNENIKKHYLTLTRSSNKYINSIKNLLFIKRCIKKINSDIVISLATPAINKHLIISLLGNKVKLIMSERNDPYNYPNTTILRIIRNISYKVANNVVFQTDDAKEFFTEDIKKKGIVIPNPVKLDLPYPHVGKRKKQIVNFCRLAPQKNLHMLLDAFKILIEEYPEYKLIIYGRGPLEYELKTYAKKLIQSGNVIFKDYTANIHNDIVDSEMFVSSSNYEGISNSMIEAMAIGLPTICTDCPIGGARMIIDNYKNGILVPVGDVEALYKAMKEVIEDESLKNNLSKNAVLIKEKLSQDNIFHQWLDVVNS